MTFDQIKARIVQYINRDELTPLVEEWVNMALRRVQRNHNFECMEARETLSASTPYLSIPTGFKEAIWLNVLLSSGNYKRLDKMSANLALQLYPYFSSVTGEPEVWFTSTGISAVVVRPDPDKSYTFDMYFYKWMDELSTSNATNWFTLNHPELLIQGGMIEASAYLKDAEMISIWTGMFKQTLAEVVSHDNSRKIDGGFLNIYTQ